MSPLTANSPNSPAPIRAFVIEKRLSTYTFEFYPHLWERNPHRFGMKKAVWKYVYYDSTSTNKLPEQPGIYMFVVSPRHAYIRDHTYIFYVGQAKNIRKRFKQYLNEELGEDETDRERIVDFLDRFKGHIFFNYHLCPLNELDEKEDYLVDHIFPWANSRHKNRIKAIINKGQPA